MEQAVSARTPAHLWIVGALALLWNAFGAYDYLMTRTHNLEYLRSSMPNVDPGAAIAWVEGMPMFSQVGWGLGVWCGLAGSILLVMRSRFAVWAFILSMLGIVLSIGYQLVAAPPLPGAPTGPAAIMPYVIIAVGAGLLVYSSAMLNKRTLR